MRIALVGLGSIGRRHLANLRLLVPDADITVVRHRRTTEGPPEGADRVVFSRDEALARKPELAVVCGPTSTHAEDAAAFAACGAHLFIEKPIAADTAGAQRVVSAVAASGVTCVVGYNFRFLPSLRALRAAAAGGSIGRVMSVRAEVGQYLPEWRPAADYRTTNSARAALGGDVTLELSHEIDYVRWLCGEVADVGAVLARTSDLEIDVDDTAELLLRFRSGAVGSVHLDMTQRAPVRTCRIAGTDGTLTWDGLAGVVRRFVPGTGWDVLHDGDPERNQMYIDEAAHVLACVRGEEEPLIDAADGARTVAVAAAARRAAAAGIRTAP